MIHACFPFYNFVHTPYNYLLRNYVNLCDCSNQNMKIKSKEYLKNANTGEFSSDSRYANMKKKVVGIFDQIENRKKSADGVVSYILGKFLCVYVNTCKSL